MPITENNFTAAELQAAVTANPALAAELKTFGTTANYVIRSKDEDTTFMTNFEKDFAGKKTSEFANAVEADILATWGQPKKENEKYHDYLKRVIGEAKTGVSEAQKALNDFKASSNGTPQDKDRIKQLEDLLASEKQSFTTEKGKLETQISEIQTGSEIKTSIAGLRARYQKGIATEIASAFEGQIVADVQKNTRLVDGKYVVVDAENKVIMDKTTYAPKAIAAILEERLAPIMDNGQAGAGAGGNSQQQQQQADGEGLVKDATGKITDIVALPADVKTQMQLTDYMKKLALVQGTPEYNIIFKKYGEKLPLR